MAYLVDTNVSARRVLLSDPLYGVVKSAIDALILNGETVCVTAQNLVEFQALATRPLDANGLGLSPKEANERAADIEALFAYLPEVPQIYSQWRSLMDTVDVRGRQVYDARLVAVMSAYGITKILTFNGSHFRRFPGIIVVEPKDISPTT